MWRTLLRWLALLLLGTAFLGPAQPQTQPQATDKKTTLLELRRGEEQLPVEKAPPTPRTGPRLFVFEYVLAFAATLLILIIVCTPSRKR